MLSAEQNARLTQIGPNSPAGNLLRQYWVPAALSDELAGDRPVVPVRLMGEDLVLFRGENNQLSLVQRHCPHRGADLCYGRLEGDSLRCVFHGWLFDQSGQCVEQPAEPEGSKMHQQIKLRNYPVIERNGIVFAYMAGGTPPAFPNIDCFRAPHSHVFAFKGLWQCNWLQALEVGIDPAHASFLHRFLEDEDPAESYGKQFRDTAADTEIPMTQLLREFPRPDLEIEETAFGLRLIAKRKIDDQRLHVRVTNQLFPCAITIPMSNEMNITQWHVPIDDTNCYWYAMFTSFTDPVDKEKMRSQRLKEHRLPDYAPHKNQSNQYHYDPVEQQKMTYTGMGQDINVHDQWACESMGAIQDRTDEHLGRTDVGIIRYRRILSKMIEKCGNGEADLLMTENTSSIQGPRSIDAITSLENWQQEWQDFDDKRRSAASWEAHYNKEFAE